MKPNTTQEERAQCLADMADAEYGKLMNFDVTFSLARRLIVDVHLMENKIERLEKELAESRKAIANVESACTREMLRAEKAERERDAMLPVVEAAKRWAEDDGTDGG